MKNLYSVFIDVEKEVYGKGDRTLFIYDPYKFPCPVVGVGFKGQEDHELFSVKEILSLIPEWRVERVYIGARETDIDPGLVHLFLNPTLRVTFETSILQYAQEVQEKFGHRVDVVYRVAGDFSVKVRQGSRLTFVKSMELWTENTQIDGVEIRKAESEHIKGILERLKPPIRR